MNVVRRKEQVEVLEKLGAKYIVDTSDPEWKPALGKLASAGSMLLDGSGSPAFFRCGVCKIADS